MPADPVDRAYRLEMSSPGIDRPLGAAIGFERYAGNLVKIEMAVAATDQTVPRELLGAEGHLARIHLENAPSGEPTDVMLPIEDIAEAKLMHGRVDCGSAPPQQAGRARADAHDNQPPLAGPTIHQSRGTGFQAPRAENRTAPSTKENERWPSAPTARTVAVRGCGRP